MADQYAKNTPPAGAICPFSMGNPNGPQQCNPQCKLYRPGKPGYECYIQELQAISWNTRRPNQPAGYQGFPQQ